MACIFPGQTHFGGAAFRGPRSRMIFTHAQRVSYARRALFSALGDRSSESMVPTRQTVYQVVRPIRHFCPILGTLTFTSS